VSNYLRNSRNFFFISVFVILLVQLITLWSKPELIQNKVGESITSQLHEYDKEMNSFCNNPTIDSIANDFSSLNKNKNWEKFIQLTKDKNFNAIIFQKDKLSYWSKTNAIPNYNYLKLQEGNNFRRLDNGWYIIQQKTIGKSKVICLFNVYKDYSYQNEYLTNRYNPDLKIKDYVEINSFVKNKGFIIKDLVGKNLFSISINSDKYYSDPSLLIIYIWILFFIFSYLTVNSFAKYLWYKGETYASFLFILFCVFIARGVSMYWSVPVSIYQLPIFSPEKYASNFIFPSLGDLIINLILIHWLIYFLFDRIKDLNFRIYNTKVSYILSVVFIFSSYLILDLIDYLFEGLVINSNISFELTNILSLTIYSAIGFFVISLMMYSFYLYNDMLLGIFHQFFLSKKEKFNVIIIGLIVVFISKIFLDEINILFYSNTLFLIILERSKSKRRNYMNLIMVVIVMSVFAIATSSRLMHFNTIKEKENRQLLASKLESANDPIAEYLLEGLTKKIQKDENIKKYFYDNSISSEYLNSRIQQLYFGGYFSKYDITVFEFDSLSKPMKTGQSRTIEYFDDIIYNKSTPTFNPNFSYKSNTLGLLTYYGKIPLYNQSKLLGWLILELKSKYFKEENIFPELLLEGSLKLNKDFNAYSYSIYKDGKLISQQGSYPYSLQATEFSGSVKEYDFLEFNKYNHLIYKANKDVLIVVSKSIDSKTTAFTTFSYVFGLFAFFLLIFYLRRLLGKRFNLLTINFNNIPGRFKILFKTRIQLSLILTILLSLGIVGYITFVYITDQYTKQQNERLSQKVRSILLSIEKKSYLINYWNNTYDDQMSVELKSLSDLYLTDINIFNLSGDLLISTQPKIYEEGLVARIMNPDAYVMMKCFERSEYSTTEKIGSLKFLSSYAPIRNANNKTVAYLNLPYFANKLEYENRVSQFLTTFINVYVLIFVVIGFIAFFIANSITYPLTLIEEQLRETKIGKKMDPITWKGSDEIGKLINEYNRMIEELEESTDRLAKSERENAWREMAKQVAHEIKNPLTPMKLGLQHLQRAWADEDPNFKEKFERFSTTFIQQIESLSLIASEFSNFAQMPLTSKEKVDLKEIITNVVELYKNESDVELNLGFLPSLQSSIMADKDQMIRCFNNLIKNAIQSIPSQRNGKVTIDLMNDTGNILVMIQDNGNGIDEELQEKIFQPNFTTKNSGMGMGLAIVHNIIINANGKIWFQSALNKGTTFYVSIPLEKGNA
jgi:two-component system, NtrC family, nitrogen regulation sensor histidine kinase NtrY